jgi:hypothetical protein
VPSHEVVQKGNAMQTTITKEGMTQESYILDKNSSEKDEDTSREERNDFRRDEGDTLFVSSLLLEDLT